MQMRIQELAAYADKVRFDSQEQVENYKNKYNDYKGKLKKANVSIQTLSTRLAKQELHLAAEREIGRVDSVRMIGSQFSGAPGANLGAQRLLAGFRSNGSALSPAGVYDEYNVGDLENQELNEEIKKLLMEN